jgi:hypothetical protein
MVPFWDLLGHINDLTSKKNPLRAPQNLITKLFGQQPVDCQSSIPFGSRIKQARGGKVREIDCEKP